jgi:hypothetical protein
MFSIKTPELRRQTIVAAMYGTFEKNEAKARQFWQKVSRGGVEFEDSHPTTVLDAFLKSTIEDTKKLERSSGIARARTGREVRPVLGIRGSVPRTRISNART